MRFFSSDDKRERFRRLIDAIGDRVYNFAYQLSGDQDEAKDLVQQAFSHAYEHLDRYDPGRPFGPWLNRILRNIFLDRVRRYEKKHATSLDALSPLEDSSWETILSGRDPQPVDAAIRGETTELVQRALAEIPEHYRAAVVLCDLEDMSYEDVGRILGVPIGTVRSRIHQGRRLLKRAYIRLSSGEPAIDL